MLAISASQSARLPSRWSSRLRRAALKSASSLPRSSRVRRAASRWSGAGVVGGSQPAAASGEHGKRARDLRADGVDGADVEAVRLIEQRQPRLPVAFEDGEGKLAGLAVEAVGGCQRMSSAWAAFKCASTRSRISAVALWVKVMARTCSGSVTDSSARSLRKRWMSRPVLPEPAGASTMKERRMSRASARAAASGGWGSFEGQSAEDRGVPGSGAGSNRRGEGREGP